MTAPAFRRVCQLTGDVAEQRPSKFFTSLENATKRAAELDLMRETFTAAIGFYSCPCGSEFEFDADSGIEDYAALNRWLGLHCSEDHNALLRIEASDVARAATERPAADAPANLPVPAAGHPTQK